MKLHILLAVTLVSVAVPLRAKAQQPWLTDRRYGEGMGIRVGDVELHPGIAGEVGYDSNYFLRAPAEGVIDAFRLRITPSFSVATLGPQRQGGVEVAPLLAFRAGAYAGYNELIATQSRYSQIVSDQRHVNAGANLRLDILPKGPVGLGVFGDYVRVAEPSNNPGEQWAFDRGTLIAGSLLNFRPGGGLFEVSAGYEFGLNYFEQNAFRSYNNTQHSVLARGRWRFLPRTALLYDGRYTFIHYGRAATTQNEGQLLKSRIGLNGLVTHRVGLLAMLGWGASFYEPRAAIPASQYDSLLAQAELKFYLTAPPTQQAEASVPVALSTLSLGYSRDFSNGYLGPFYQMDRGYLNLSYFLSGALLLSLEGGLTHYGYPASYFLNGSLRNNSFSADRIDAKLFAEYRFSDSFGVNATVRYDQNLADEKVRTELGGSVDDLAFARWQAYLGVRWFL